MRAQYATRAGSMQVGKCPGMMLPFPQFASDGKDHELSEVTEHIANHFKLTQQERDELLPSGNQTRLFIRVGWCRTHLKNALMIEYLISLSFEFP